MNNINTYADQKHQIKTAYSYYDASANINNIFIFINSYFKPCKYLGINTPTQFCVHVELKNTTQSFSDLCCGTYKSNILIFNDQNDARPTEEGWSLMNKTIAHLKKTFPSMRKIRHHNKCADLLRCFTCYSCHYFGYLLRRLHILNTNNAEIIEQKMILDEIDPNPDDFTDAYKECCKIILRCEKDLSEKIAAYFKSGYNSDILYLKFYVCDYFHCLNYFASELDTYCYIGPKKQYCGEHAWCGKLSSTSH